MKILSTNDWHLTTRNPVARTDDYLEELFSLLDQVSRLAIKVGVRFILHAGDVFHRKDLIQHGLVNRVIEYCKHLQEHGIEILAIPGNHDLKNDRYESLGEQPIGTLFASGAMKNISWACRLEYDQPDLDVMVTGIPWPMARYIENFSRAPVEKESPSTRFCVAHCFAAPQGGEFFGERVHAYTEMVNLPFDVFVFGHYHGDLGVTEINGKQFIQIGALSRGSVAKENLNRHVKVALIETFKGAKPKVTQVRLDYRPAAEIFDLALRAQKEKEVDEIEQFVEQIQPDLEALGVDYKTRLSQMEMSQEVRHRVNSYLEKAEAQA